MKAAHEYVIGVGANLGSRVATIRAALACLAEEALVTAVGVSKVYASAALGPPAPAYLNLAVRVTSTLEPDALWARMSRIEHDLGRIRRERWGPRTIDLDVLWCGRNVRTASLRVPHPELERRWFALAPLLEVAPEAGARYHEALDALGGPPVPGRALESLTRAELHDEEATLHIACTAENRADALAEALGMLGRASTDAPDHEGSLVVRALQVPSTTDDLLAACTHAVLDQTRRGAAPLHVAFRALDDDRADGCMLVAPAGPRAWELAATDEQAGPEGHRVGLAFSRRITEG